MGYKIPLWEQKRYGKSLSGSRKDTENPYLGAKKSHRGISLAHLRDKTTLTGIQKMRSKKVREKELTCRKNNYITKLVSK